MNKLKSAVMYECSTKIKAIGLFYLIEYLIVALIFAIVAICTNGKDTGSNILEISTVIFVSVIGVLGYKEDFKALIQNGYTRKYIFTATVCMFIFMCASMALIDTVIGNTIHYFNNNYFTLYGILYGYDNPFLNWLWLTVFYLSFCSLFYLAVLIINKVGKRVSLFISIVLGGVIVIIIALFRFVFSSETVHNIAEFSMKAMGFMTDGTKNVLFPVISFLIAGVALEIASYTIIRRTELK